jgi:hypothetical protein
MCVVADAPLPVDTRIAVVELAVRHELIAERCRIEAQRVLPPRGFIEHLKYLFGWRQHGFCAVEEGAPGAWIACRLRELDGATDYQVVSRFPRWKGESVTGPFVYHVHCRARPVQIFNAYRSPEECSPHAAEGVIGQFFDVLTLDAKRGVDGRSAASSGFVRELKELTGAKVICRTSWS